MKHFLLLISAIFWAAAMQAQVDVTFQVDISSRTDFYNGGAVWVYMDADWNEYYTMTDDNQDGIYSYTVSYAEGTAITFSYSYQTGPDEWNDYVVESVPAECADANGWRTLTVPASNTVLDAVAYGSCSATAIPKVTVIFKVDMSNETVSGDGVQVVIKNPWIWTAMSDDGNGIWSASVELDGNTTYPYTFVNGAQDYWDGEESITGDCNMGTAEAPERQVAVAEEDVTLSAVMFGACDAATSISSVRDEEVTIYPNPVDELLDIQSSFPIKAIKVTSLTGESIASFNGQGNKSSTVNLGAIKGGVYLLTVCGDGIQKHLKILIR